MLVKKLILAMLFILMLAAGNALAGGDVANGETLAAYFATLPGK